MEQVGHLSLNLLLCTHHLSREPSQIPVTTGLKAKAAAVAVDPVTRKLEAGSAANEKSSRKPPC